MYICICEEVTDKQIKSAIKGGAKCMRDLRKELGIASQCGQCGQCAKAILKEHCSNNNCSKSAEKKLSSPTDMFPFFSEQLLVTE